MEFLQSAWTLFTDNWEVFLRGAYTALLLAIIGTICGALIGFFIGIMHTIPQRKMGIKTIVLKIDSLEMMNTIRETCNDLQLINYSVCDAGRTEVSPGTFTVIGWAINVPPSKQQAFTFPVSQIRGKLQTLGATHPSLVDQLSDFVDMKNLPVNISRFYERTTDYRLFASVKWRLWFKPFAFIYQSISRRIQQLAQDDLSEPF